MEQGSVKNQGWRVVIICPVSYMNFKECYFEVHYKANSFCIHVSKKLSLRKTWNGRILPPEHWVTFSTPLIFLSFFLKHDCRAILKQQFPAVSVCFTLFVFGYIDNKCRCSTQNLASKLGAYRRERRSQKCV